MNWTEQPYAWTGSNQTLSSGPVLFLDSYTPGNLTCVAMNEISEEGFSPVVPTCRGTVTPHGLSAYYWSITVLSAQYSRPAHYLSFNWVGQNILNQALKAHI